jgi:hypothetical protein
MSIDERVNIFFIDSLKFIERKHTHARDPNPLRNDSNRQNRRQSLCSCQQTDTNIFQNISTNQSAIQLIIIIIKSQENKQNK